MNLKEDWPLFVGGLAVVFVILYVVNSKTTAGQSAVGYTTVNADPNVLAAQTAAVQAQTTAATTIAGDLISLDAQQGTNALAATQANDALQLGLAQSSYGAENAIIQSGNALKATTTIANDQLAAQQAAAKAAQNASLWNDIFGIIPGVESIFTGGASSLLGGASSGAGIADLAASAGGSF